MVDNADLKYKLIIWSDENIHTAKTKFNKFYVWYAPSSFQGVAILTSRSAHQSLQRSTTFAQTVAICLQLKKTFYQMRIYFTRPKSLWGKTFYKVYHESCFFFFLNQQTSDLSGAISFSVTGPRLWNVLPTTIMFLLLCSHPLSQFLFVLNYVFFCLMYFLSFCFVSSIGFPYIGFASILLPLLSECYYFNLISCIYLCFFLLEYLL